MNIIEKFFKEGIKKNIKVQEKKPRYGNRVVVTGGGSYYGWATICQLAYKFPGCSIFTTSKNFIYKKATRKLEELFGSTVKIVSNYKDVKEPDILIDLDNSVTDIICRSIFVRSFDKQFRAFNYDYPVTFLNCPVILGNWNIITLIDGLKISNEYFITNIFRDLLRKELNIVDEIFPYISLEDFTRTIVKLCRLEKPPLFDQFQLFEQYISLSKLYKYCSDELCMYDLPYNFTISEKIETMIYKIDKSKFIKLIDKHRCGLELLIKYSCLETIMDVPLSDYKKFIIERYPSNIKKHFLEKKKRKKFITKDTKIVSIGSCFAENIANYLRSKGYNYLITEEGANSFSADWGIVFNSTSIRQIFEYSFGLFKPIVRWWKREGNVQDPFRRNVLYTKGREKKEIKKHIKASHQAISEADVIIITLGLVEVWRDKRDSATYWRVPPMHLYDKNIHEFYVMTKDDVYNDLVKIKKILDKENPKCKLVITVSPVPFQATYRTDVDVVTANVYSKAISTVAAIDFCTQNNTIYFPSFEFVRYGFDNPYTNDGRHIKKEVINKMMKFFESTFCLEENK